MSSGAVQAHYLIIAAAQLYTSAKSSNSQKELKRQHFRHNIKPDVVHDDSSSFLFFFKSLQAGL